MTLSITTLGMMTFSIMALMIGTFSIMTLGRDDTQHYDIQHDIQHNDTMNYDIQYDIQHNDTMHMTFSITAFSIMTFSKSIRKCDTQHNNTHHNYTLC